MEVSVSPDPDNAHVSGSVALVKDGYVSKIIFYSTYKRILYVKKLQVSTQHLNDWLVYTQFWVVTN